MSPNTDLLCQLVKITELRRTKQREAAAQLAIQLLRQHRACARLWRLLSVVYVPDFLGIPEDILEIGPTLVPKGLDYEQEPLALKQQAASSPANGRLQYNYRVSLGIYALKVAMALDPHDPVFPQKLGFDESVRTNYKASEDYFNLAISVDPDYQNALTSSIFFFNNSLRDLKRRASFIARLEHTIAVNPEHSHAYYNLADFYAAEGRIQDAEACCRMALLSSVPLHAGYPEFMRSFNPKQILYHLHSANNLRASDHQHIAIEMYLEIINRFGSDPNLLAAIASCYYALTGKEQHNNNARFIGGLSPGRVGQHPPSLADIAAAEADRRESSYPSIGPEEAQKQAISWAAQAVAAAPGDARLRAVLGKYLSDVDPSEAANEYRQAIELNPKNGSTLFAAAGLYHKATGKISLAEAIDWTERALKVSPDDPTYFFQLGDLYRKAGREEAAIQAWVKALLCEHLLDEQHTKIIEEYCCK